MALLDAGGGVRHAQGDHVAERSREHKVTQRIFRHSGYKLGPYHVKLLGFSPHVLDEGLENLKEDARAQGKSHLQHPELSLAGADG